MYRTIVGKNSEWPKMAILNFPIFPKKTGTHSEWSKMAIQNFFQQFFPKRLISIQNGQKWSFQIFPTMAILNFFQQFFSKRLIQIWNGQKWLLQFFSNNFCQKDWNKLEWPKIAIPNFSKRDWYKFGIAQNGCSKFFPTIFPKKDWYKCCIRSNICVE